MSGLIEFCLDEEAFKERPEPDASPQYASPGPAPCDACPKRRTCMDGQACPDFQTFVFDGTLSDQDRTPSGVVYRRVFSKTRRVSEALAPQVLELSAKGYSCRRIGKQLSLGKDTVLDIIKRDRAKNSG